MQHVDKLEEEFILTEDLNDRRENIFYQNSFERNLEGTLKSFKAAAYSILYKC